MGDARWGSALAVESGGREVKLGVGRQQFRGEGESGWRRSQMGEGSRVWLWEVASG